MSEPASNGNGKKSAMEVIGESIPIAMVLAAIGGMALTPLYIMANNNAKEIEELKTKFETHTQLPGHPVMQANLAASILRLDEEIKGSEKQAEENRHEIGTINSELSEIKTQNTRSIDDRAALTVEADETRKISVQLQSECSRESAERVAALIEVETQIDSMAQSLGIQFSNTQRELEDFQNAFHELGVKMSIAPTGPFYVPNISNRNMKK